MLRVERHNWGAGDREEGLYAISLLESADVLFSARYLDTAEIWKEKNRTFTEAMGEGLEQLAAQAPAGRPATADEIAEAIVFLATDRASFIYGATLAVDGGRTAI